MKPLNKLLALALLGSFSYASAEMSVDKQIEQIKNAPAQKRVELMNQFKIRLRSMNEDDREKAIEALRTKTQEQTRTEEQTRAQEQTRTEEQTRLQNEQEDQQLRIQNQTQQMNQMQGVDQWEKMGQPGAQENGDDQKQIKIPMH